MAARTFRASDGTTWTVSRIDSSTMGDVPGMPREWLLFQDEGATQRRRLTDFPDDWESLSEARLAILMRLAKPGRSGTPPTPPGGTPRPRDP